MKIRTITTGIFLRSVKQLSKIKKAAQFNQEAKSIFENKGYEVQTTRMCTNSWEDYLGKLPGQNFLKEVKKIEKVCKESGINFFSIGHATTPKTINMLAEVVINTSDVMLCSAKIGDTKAGINYPNIKASAKVIKTIAKGTKNGFGNFKFSPWVNCKPDTPFGPVSYHEEKKSAFAIGLECSDLVMKAFSKANSLKNAEQRLKNIFEKELGKIDKIARMISKKYNIAYKGIDASLAPSLKKNESIAFAYEKLGFGKFGHQGTLTISAIITKVLKNLSVRTCGYSGLMLPVCEDFGLAKRANEKTYGLTNLLLYSAVCGCGLDVVPVPGNISSKKIEAVLSDMATLGIKLDKPLSARLFPIPGKKAGQMTTFNSPYLVDCKILEVK